MAVDFTEVLVGAGIGWSASLVIAGARQAGEIVGAQAGLSAAALFDPEAGEDLTALGHLYGLVALGVFPNLIFRVTDDAVACQTAAPFVSKTTTPVSPSLKCPASPLPAQTTAKVSGG